MLKNLCPSASTELTEIAKISPGNKFHSLLPSALGDDLLLSLTRDLKVLARSNADGVSNSFELASPLYLIGKLASRNLNYTDTKTSVKFNLDALDNALALLEKTFEREILGRILGISDAASDEQFLASLDACLSL